MFVDLCLEFSENLLVNVVEHPHPEQQLVVVSVQVLAVVLVQEHLRVILLLLSPASVVWDGVLANILGLLSFSSSWHRS